MNTTTPTRHNHNDGKAMPYGRLKPAGECPRCDELHQGAPARELAWTHRDNNGGYPTSAEISSHFARHVVNMTVVRAEQG